MTKKQEKCKHLWAIHTDGITSCVLCGKIETYYKATSGVINSATRRALNIFDKWNNVTGFVPKHSGYYYEIQGIIEDAVHCGIQELTDNYKKLNSEKY
jgi:hypothetical protein